MAESGLRIRVDNHLRHQFIQTCKAKDATAAQVLRAFMRQYIEQFGVSAVQGALFDGTAPPQLEEQRKEA